MCTEIDKLKVLVYDLNQLLQETQIKLREAVTKIKQLEKDNGEQTKH